MNYLLLFSIILLSQPSVGQIFVNRTDINKLEVGTHIQVEAGYYVTPKLKVSVDYGQELSGQNHSKVTLDGGFGEKEFNSPVEVLNFFLTNGWELVDFSFVLSEARVYTYVLKRVKR